MSETNPAPVIPKWLSRSIVTLLALQVGLLWTHGSLLQRQHDDILALREDVQALAESLDQDQDDWDSNEIDPHPALWVRHQGRRMARTAYLRAGEEDDQSMKDLDAARKSAQEAVAKARDTQEKMSVQASIEKAQARAETGIRMRWVWAAAAVGAGVGLLVRTLLRRR